MSDYAYTIKEVSYTYESNDLIAIDNISVMIKHNRTTALLGPNGAGKSTLMDLLLSFRIPSRGKISLYEEPLSHTQRKIRKDSRTCPSGREISICL